MKIVFLLVLFLGQLVASPAFINSTELESQLSKKNLVILDITDFATYKDGHIPNAVNADVFKFRKKVKTYQLMKSSAEVQKIVRSLGINNDSEVVIYGHGKSKELLKSSYVALTLITHGLTKVSILDGAYSDWLFENQTLTSTDIPQVKKGHFVAKYNPNILVDLSYVKDSINKVDMIESRPKSYFDGRDKSKGVRRLGHIPNAMSSFWKEKFNSDNSVLDKEDLEEIYIKTHKLTADKEVIVYCTGGLEASMNWYILSQHLGFKDVKIYDASMREWGNRDDTPMTIKD